MNRKQELIALAGKEKLRKALLYLLAIVMIFCIAGLIYFLFFINTDIYIRIVGTAIIVLVCAIWLISEYRSSRPQFYDIESPIKRFVLMNRDGDKEKEWYCEGITSFLIGKGTVNSEVDIELGDTHYCAYISNQHAVLNFSKGFWYIEDLNSKNGVGIKKRGEEYALRLKPMVSYKIDEGDIIYISKAKLLVR